MSNESLKCASQVAGIVNGEVSDEVLEMPNGQHEGLEAPDGHEARRPPLEKEAAWKYLVEMLRRRREAEKGSGASATAFQVEDVTPLNI